MDPVETSTDPAADGTAAEPVDQFDDPQPVGVHVLSRILGATVTPILVLLAPVLSVAWATWTQRPRAIPFFPDLPQTELGVLSVLHGEQFVGAYSRYGWYHPGPLFFYALAPLYALDGRHSSALGVGSLLINAAALAAIVWLCGRMAGSSGRWTAAAVLVAFTLMYGIEGYASAWNPNLLAVPTALAIVSVAAVGWGARAGLPVATVALTWVLQTHAGTALVVAGLGVTLAVFLVGHLRRDGWYWKKTAWVSLGVFVLLWVPPLIDAVAGTGNPARLTSYFLRGETFETPYSFEVDPQFQPLSPVDATRNVLGFSAMVGGEMGRVTGFDLTRSRDTDVSPLLSVVGLAVTVGAGVAAARRKHDWFAGNLAVPALVALGASIVSAAKITGEYSHYLLAFVPGVGAVLWLAAVSAGVEAVRQRLPVSLAAPAPAVRVAVGSVAAVALLATSWTMAQTRMPAIVSEEPGDTGYAAMLLPTVAAGDGPVRIVVRPDSYTDPDIARVAVDLQKAGYDVQTERRWVLAASLDQAPDTAAAHQIVVQPENDPPPEGMTQLGTMRGRAFYLGPPLPADPS